MCVCLNSFSQHLDQLSSQGSSGALLSQRKNSEAALTVTSLPGSSSELFSQVLKESSVIISSSYNLSK